MQKLSIAVVLTIVIGFSLGSGQTPNAKSVNRIDPALDAIVSPNAKLEVVKGDYFAHTEGPVWMRDGQSGYLLFSDIGANVIYKWTTDGKLSVFLERSGYTGPNPSSLGKLGYIGGSTNGRFWFVAFGSNGLAVDPQGRLVWCAQGDRTVVRLEKDGKTRTVLADRYEGKRLSRPNDLVIKSNGAVYFTDGKGTDQTEIELDFNGMYLLKDGKIQLLGKDLGGNGIALSPDEKYFYSSGGGKTWRYDIQPDDTLANRKEFSPESCGALKVDQKGNVFCVGGGVYGPVQGDTPGRVSVISPAGKTLGTITTPEGPSNIAFGDADGKTLYVTMRRTLARIRLNTTGLRPSS